MDLGTLTSQLAQRQPLFWVAAASLALGGAFLTASLILVVRKAGRAGRPRSGSAAPAMAVAPAPRPDASPASATVPDPARAQAADGEEPSLALLLRRLQGAGDRLEGIAGDLEALAAAGDDCSLKERAAGVEYVFRASGA